jgi:hypothetical protein
MKHHDLLLQYPYETLVKITMKHLKHLNIRLQHVFFTLLLSDDTSRAKNG